MRPHEWIITGEVGVSSKAIWAFFMGVELTSRTVREMDVPHDPDDYRRCRQLLAHFPEWRQRLHEMGECLPHWRPMIREWETVEMLWEEESPSKRCPKLFQLMQRLRNEGRALTSGKENVWNFAVFNRRRPTPPGETAPKEMR